VSAALRDLTLPRLSESMQEGTIVAWLRAEGEEVRAGEPLVEIETDKSTVAHAAEGSGRLLILVPEGETVAVGTIIARLAGAGAAPAPPAEEPRPPAAEPVPLPGPPGAAATPLARRLAGRHGVDLAGVRGTGPGGFVLRGDVLAAAGLARPPVPPPLPTANGGADGATLVEPTRIQRVVAERMETARATIPAFSMRVDVDMAEAVALRERLRELTGDDPAPTINDLVIKAAALALREVPRANASVVDGRFALHERVHVGVAVAAPDALLVPVVRDADRRPLAEIARESRRLAAAAREGRLPPVDLEGGTFTVSNLGPFGIHAFTAIINPPQAAILAVGAVREEPVVRAGQIRAGHVMSLTLSGDHRILNGADGAGLLSGIRARLEAPLLLALG
jgi:pyruvate dehydrogenase E2 component (dihydrolipoamide acetyltransferase)